jgi:hypothetical protein
MNKTEKLEQEIRDLRQKVIELELENTRLRAQQITPVPYSVSYPVISPTLPRWRVPTIICSGDSTFTIT